MSRRLITARTRRLRQQDWMSRVRACGTAGTTMPPRREMRTGFGDLQIMDNLTKWAGETLTIARQ